MKKIVPASLRWRTLEDGGRQSPPGGPKYSTVARFEKQKESWPREAWSVFVEFIEPPNSALSHRVNIRFLADGPEELLEPGSVFELMEGRQSVADGIITGLDTVSAGSSEMTRVKALFPLQDQNKLIVHLCDFDWDFKAFGPVTFVVGRERMCFNYTASGNQEGVPFVVLQAAGDSAPELIQRACALFDATAVDCWLLRCSEVKDNCK